MRVISWLALVASWILTLLVMKYVFIVLRVLKQIRRLAEMTRDTATHLAANVADAAAFAELEMLAEQLPAAIRALPRGTAVAKPPVSSVSPGLGGRIP